MIDRSPDTNAGRHSRVSMLDILFVVVAVSLLLSPPVASSCPYIRTSMILAECTFDTEAYRSFGAQIRHSNAVQFLGYYSLSQTNSSGEHLRNSLIYNLGNRWMFLVPLLIKCAHQPRNFVFTECQYTMRARSSSTAEYMTTQLTLMNSTDSTQQAVLFLQAGQWRTFAD